MKEAREGERKGGRVGETERMVRLDAFGHNQGPVGPAIPARARWNPWHLVLIAGEASGVGGVAQVYNTWPSRDRAASSHYFDAVDPGLLFF